MLASPRLPKATAKPSFPRIPASKGDPVSPLHSRASRIRNAAANASRPATGSATSATSSPSPPLPPPRPRPPLPLLDQASTPLLDAVLLRGARSSEAPFHVPGHKRGAGIAKEGGRRRRGGGGRRHPLARLMGGERGGDDGGGGEEEGEESSPCYALRHDLTELPGLDLLSQPEGAILGAQRLAAEAWGVSETRFLVNGSTGGIAAAVLACCRLWARRPRREREVVVAVEAGESGGGDDDDDEDLRLSRPLVLIPRGAHRSAAAAAELAGAEVVWIEEEGEAERGGREESENDASPSSSSSSSSSSFESRWGSEGLGRVVTAEGIRRALQLAQELDFTTSTASSSSEGRPDEGKRRRGRGRWRRTARLPAAVLVVSPSYFGACSDASALASACCLRRRKIPLIVDQAHGAHFGLDRRFPPCAASAASSSSSAAAAAAAAGEAEAKTSSSSPPPAPPPSPPSLPVVIAVASAHKTLDALGQSALLHSGKGVSYELQGEIDRALAVLQTSSPSYLLLASLDAARAAGVGGGDSGGCGGGGNGVEGVEGGRGGEGGEGGGSEGPWDEPLRAASLAAEAVRSVPGAHLLSDEREARSRGKTWDPLRLTVRLEGVGGRALAAALEGSGGDGDGDGDDGSESGATAVVEMATSRALVLALGAGSTVEHAEAFGRALRRVARRAREGRVGGGGGGGGESRGDGDGTAAAAAASFSFPSSSSYPSRTTELIPLRASLGRRSAGILAPYPPGVPIVHEGEALTAAAVEAAAEAWEAGAAVVGLFSERDDEREREGREVEGESGNRRRVEPSVRVLR